MSEFDCENKYFFFSGRGQYISGKYLLGNGTEMPALWVTRQEDGRQHTHDTRHTNFYEQSQLAYLFILKFLARELNATSIWELYLKVSRMQGNASNWILLLILIFRRVMCANLKFSS